MVYVASHLAARRGREIADEYAELSSMLRAQNQMLDNMLMELDPVGFKKRREDEALAAAKAEKRALHIALAVIFMTFFSGFGFMMWVMYTDGFLKLPF
jgi:predicted anti-sigma-YlaC factor YlaD